MRHLFNFCAVGIACTFEEQVSVFESAEALSNQPSVLWNLKVLIERTVTPIINRTSVSGHSTLMPTPFRNIPRKMVT